MTARRLTADDLEIILVLREQGLLHKEIAHVLGIADDTVRRWCKRLGVEKPLSTHPESVKSRRWYRKRKLVSVDAAPASSHHSSSP